MASDLGDILLRAAHLLALAIAPPFLSPAPPVAGSSSGAIVAALLLAAMVYAAGRLRVRPGGRAGLAAAALIGAAVAAALIAADVFRGDRAPLGRGVLYVAVPLWAGLAVVAGAFAERRRRAPLLGGARRALRRAPFVAAAVVAGVGTALLAASAGWLFSPEQMWLAELRGDGDDAIAVDALTRAPLRAKRHDAVLAVLDRCLAAIPTACACLTRRAQIGIHTDPGERVLAEARNVSTRCPASAAARAGSAEALALYGDAEQAEQEARAGLARSDDARLRYALALALDRGGRHSEAIDEAKRAVKMGAGRDASLLWGSLSIAAGDLDSAAEALRPIIAADPDDADAQYDLALVADRRNDYNPARQGYLAALRAEPQLAAARYNLVLLTLRTGAVEEARHHAQRFATMFPGDPRGPMLAQRIADAARRP